jgi:hypothetical protein
MVFAAAGTPSGCSMVYIFFLYGMAGAEIKKYGLQNYNRMIVIHRCLLAGNFSTKH